MDTDFDWEIYINNYEDLQNAGINTREEAWKHWITHGNYEGRTYKIINKKVDNFNWETYINNYEDLRNAGINTREKAWNHWILHGNHEKRTYKNINNTFLIDIKQSKICVIYVYYERKNEQKNQSNLSFFIKYGLNEKNWLKLDITYLFVINDKQCEVVIPKRKDIHVLEEENCSDYEGWSNGIKYFENLYKTKIWKKFNYLCLINSSTSGPFIEENVNNHWLMPFYNKMIENNSIICSPYINKFINMNNILSCHFSLLYIDSNIINLLINTPIKIGNYNNIIFGKKQNKEDSVLTGEFGLSNILLENGYKISNLYFDNESLNIKYNDNNLDREEFYHKNNELLKNTIFIKNIWRLENYDYASIPVLYKYCNDFMNKKLNITNIFNEIDYENNYDLININNNGINRNNSDYNWITKKEYYDLYGYAEETILFPIKNKNNNSCVIYAHYDSNNLITDYVLTGIKALICIGYDIIFYTASEKINNVDLETLPFKIIFFKNQGVGTDWKIWLEELNNIKINNINYEWILLLNDSILMPINGIKNLKNTIENMRIDTDFWGHWDSDEIKWHIIGTPIEFKYKLLDDVINFMNNNIKLCIKELDYIYIVETCFSQYLVNKGYKYKVVINKNSIIQNSVTICPTHNPYLIDQWITNKSAFAIKWKYCISYLNKDIISPEFNYLTRFLYYGPYGTKSKGEIAGCFPNSINFLYLKYNNIKYLDENLSINNTNNISLIDIKKAKICVIYVYYERKNEQKNQTNLSFFIKHGLNKKNWLNLDITYLFVINGFICEVVIPNEENIFILKEENCSDWEGWYNGIKYFENLYETDIWKKFDYLCLINAGAIGPFMESDTNTHWLLPFYNKMVEYNSPICSPCITFLPNTDAGGPGPRLVPIITLININQKIINLLINTNISNKTTNTINTDYTLYYNTIYGKKIDKCDAALTGEYGLSRIFLDNGYNICCLLYDNINYNYIHNWFINNNLAPDRYKSFNNNDLPINKVIFVKNIWRYLDYKVCLPVNIIQTQYLVNKLLNYEELKYNNLDYENVIIPNTGINSSDNSMNWYNKKTYYELYGYAEENVIFPIKKSNRSLVIYTHFDKDNIIKDYVIISIKSLIELGYVIIFCTTSEKIINVDLPLNILYYKNNGPGSNFIIWYDILKKNIQTYKSQYDWIMLLNDSILFPINGLDNFKNTIDNMRNKSDFWSHWDSNNIHDHGISSQIEYNINVIDSLLEFYSDKLNKETYTKDYFIQEIEVKQTEYLISKNFRFNSVIPYTSLNIDNDKLFSFFHPNIFDQWIQRKETFAIKWKYMLNYLNLKKINNPILNYITRYITVDSN
jgi:hypothetical protein